MNKKLEFIKKEIDQYAAKIDVPKDYLPTYEHSLDFAHPYIEIDKNDKYNYVIEERGSELSRKVFNTINDLLFQVFSDITFEMAVKYEVNNRIVGQDTRILLFKKQEELMGILNKNWEEKEKKIHTKILS